MTTEQRDTANKILDALIQFDCEGFMCDECPFDTVSGCIAVIATRNMKTIELKEQV